MARPTAPAPTIATRNPGPLACSSYATGAPLSLHELYLALLAGGVVVLASIGATRVASGLGLPSLLLFLGLGVVLGEDVLGIKFDDAQLAQNLGTAALAVILLEGGLTT